MKRLLLLIGFLFTATTHSQVLGTTQKISETQFCKTYDCQYVKVERTRSGEVWTYYLNRRANLDIERMANGKTTVAVQATLRLVGLSLTSADFQIAADFLRSVVGANILPEALTACGRTKQYMYIYYQTLDQYPYATCHRIDSSEVQFVASTRG